MQIEVVIHNHGEDRILEFLRDFRRQVMATLQEFQSAFDAVNAETTRIGALIQSLTERLAETGLSAEDEAATLAQLSAAGERLRAVGASVTEPVPPVDPNEPPVPVDPNPVEVDPATGRRRR